MLSAITFNAALEIMPSNPYWAEPCISPAMSRLAFYNLREHENFIDGAFAFKIIAQRFYGLAAAA